MRNRHKYAKNFPKRARACKDEAGWCCQKCGVKHGFMRRSIWTGNLWPVFLNAAHMDHDPDNENARLIAVCPSCHYHYYRQPGRPPFWLIEKLKHRKLLGLPI